MEYAVVKSGGKQYKVSIGDSISVDKLGSDPDQKDIIFDQVLLVADGNKVKLGTPLVNATVQADLVRHYQGEKLRVSRFKAKSNFRRVIGFRHQLTEVKVTGISLGKNKEVVGKNEEVPVDDKVSSTSNVIDKKED